MSAQRKPNGARRKVAPKSNAPKVIHLRGHAPPPPRANSAGLIRGMIFAAIPALMLWVIIVFVFRLVRGS